MIAGISVVFDQLTKWLVTEHFSLLDVETVVPGFDLVLRYNKGAAFSFLAGASGWQRGFLIGLAVLVCTSIIVWLTRLPVAERAEGVGFALILGGALGNLMDRIVYGHVIDFISLYYKEWAWPAFNLADSAICCGVTLLLITILRSSQVKVP